MLQDLTHFVAGRLGDRTFPIAVAVVAAGVFVWLLGARFSKSILALVGVGLGAWLGLHLPRWYGWNFDGMAMAMGGSLVLGLAGYLLHTTWLGGALVSNLALMFALTAWAMLAGDATWTMPVWSEMPTSQTGALRAVWASLPGDLPRVMPYAVAGGAISAVAMTLLWPGVARAASWSLIGLMLIGCGGAVAVGVRWPGESTGYLPQAAGARIALLWGLAVVGTVVQWWSLPADVPAAPAMAGAAPKTAAPKAAAPARAGELVTGGAKA